jgi:GT2 family glycosyltransferase
MVRLVPLPEETGTAPVRLPDPPPAVDILVPVHNEWHVLRPCLDSLEAFTGYPAAQITILDDGSDSFVQERMAAFVARPGPLPKRMLRNEKALGFVKNSNRGFAEARGEFVVLLNSDTLVTPDWLEGLLEAALSDPRIACVMPMSNQCSFHSLAIPMGWNVFQYAAHLRRRATRTCFDAVTAGGFCLLIRCEALRDIGPYDEAFGMGYGEESDWCMRARSRGWKIVGVEDTFVYHRGKATFKDYKEKNFKQTNYQLFMDRWADLYQKAMAGYHERDALRPLRDAYVRMDSPSAPPVLSAFIDRVRTGGPAYATIEASRYIRDQGGVRRVPAIIRERGLTRGNRYKHPLPRGFQSRRRPRVVYVLEKFALSGGVLSVVQLVNRLTLLGWDAKIATHHDHDQQYLPAYMLYHHPYVFPTAEAMIQHFPEADIVVATLWSTAFKVRRILQERLPQAIPFYFIQDDETRFFHELDQEGRSKVLESYDLIPEKIAKSDWLQGLLRERGHDCHKVRLGLDLDVFYPEASPVDRPLRILGMARPRTPRRGFAELVAAMREIKRRRPQVEVAFFGCENLADYGLDFEYADLGVVPNDRLRRVYGSSAILLDLSEFQGFGRMGLEAMACGCAAVLTKFGGIGEYARHERNCLSVDPANFGETMAAIERLVDDRELRMRLAEQGLATAQEFDCDLEARSTSRLFAGALGLEEDVRQGARSQGGRERKRAVPRDR